ncbi:hypothetical protein QFC20_006533 [Naganishia adeliensis]|uniref:Uncharacterized protein n=1 Tax=Naganishia adeliensis TaxID=92952 RepID=A0ACC2V9H6_9TREE|nr:hypothetical protein QFC20_006533 [Naganishia adeliensis]
MSPSQAGTIPSKKTFIKRKAPPDAASQPATSTRAPIPLPPSDRVLRDINSQPLATPGIGLQNGNPRQTTSDDARRFTDKQKAQLFPEVLNENGLMKKRYFKMQEAEQKTREQLQAARQLIEDLKFEAQQRHDNVLHQPIERPSITKEEAVHIRLTSTREILGLQQRGEGPCQGALDQRRNVEGQVVEAVAHNR